MITERLDEWSRQRTLGEAVCGDTFIPHNDADARCEYIEAVEQCVELLGKLGDSFHQHPAPDMPDYKYEQADVNAMLEIRAALIHAIAICEG